MPTIDITLIKSEGNVRMDLGDLTDLTKDIDRRGLIQPITVALRNGGYTVIDGHRRLQACKDLGEQEIEVSLYAFMEEDSDRIATQYQANVNRRNLTAFEQMQAMLDLKDAGYNQQNVADELNVSKKAVSKAQKTARIINDLPNSEDALKLSEDALFKVVDEANDVDPDQQTEVIGKALHAMATGQSSSVWSAVNDARRETKRAGLVEKLQPMLDELRDAGITFLDERPARADVIARHSKESNFGGTLGFNHEQVEEHRKLDCHAVRLEDTYQGLSVAEYCLKPAGHKAKGKSALKEASADTKQEQTEKERAVRKATKEAKQQRIDQARHVLENRLTQKAALSVVRTSIRLGADVQRVAAKTLGLDVPKSSWGNYPDYGTAIAAWIDALPQSKQALAPIVLIAAYQYVEDVAGAKGTPVEDLFGGES